VKNMSENIEKNPLRKSYGTAQSHGRMEKLI
jgi:hypothetical protein